MVRAGSGSTPSRPMIRILRSPNIVIRLAISGLLRLNRARSRMMVGRQRSGRVPGPFVELSQPVGDRCRRRESTNAMNERPRKSDRSLRSNGVRVCHQGLGDFAGGTSD